MKKQNVSLIAKMLNKNSQPEQKTAAEEILMLDARELVPNPKNKEYSLEDIEQLASMIQMTHNIEPATARKLEDGRFMLTSGHRRRLAQLYRFEQGWIDKPKSSTRQKAGRTDPSKETKAKDMAMAM